MKKIVFLRSNPVCPDSRVEKSVESLCKNGYSVTIVAWDRERNYKKSNDKINLGNIDVPVERFGIKSIFGSGFKKNLIPLIKFQIKLANWLIKNNKSYDIIHACDFDTALTAFICSKILKKKMIYDIFDFYIDAYSVPKILKFIIKTIDFRIINNCEATIICTEKRKEQIKGSKPKKLIVIHNTPNKELIANKSNLYCLNKKRVKFVYVGILDNGRFIMELIEIIRKKKNCELHIGGFGKLEKDIVKISNQSENIIYYGKLSYERTLQLESSCDIMTAMYDPNIPNHYYAAPNKFYEALMLGKPIIMIKKTGMDEIISNNNIGEVIEYNPNSLENAIERMINSQEKWSMISKEMKKIYQNEYCWSNMEERLINLYSNIK